MSDAPVFAFRQNARGDRQTDRITDGTIKDICAGAVCDASVFCPAPAALAYKLKKYSQNGADNEKIYEKASKNCAMYLF